MSKDLRYRFDELITTIALMPDEPDDEYNPVFPNLTRDLHEPELYTAILCQTMKGDEEFRAKMCATLNSSAMTSIMENDGADDDDLYALAISANILWASGVGTGLFTTLGILGMTLSKYDHLETPELATLILKGNNGALSFGNLDPYRILEGGYEVEDMVKESIGLEGKDLEELLNRLRERGEQE